MIPGASFTVHPEPSQPKAALRARLLGVGGTSVNVTWSSSSTQRRPPQTQAPGAVTYVGAKEALSMVDAWKGGGGGGRKQSVRPGPAAAHRPCIPVTAPKRQTCEALGPPGFSTTVTQDLRISPSRS